MRNDSIVSSVNCVSIYLGFSSCVSYGIRGLISQRHPHIMMLWAFSNRLSQCGEEFVRPNSNTNFLALANPFLRIQSPRRSAL